MIDRCKFVRAWIGSCGATPVNENGLCAEHAAMKCAACGAQAVRDCDHTGIQFVCGAPLCANCQHNAPADPRNPGLFNLGGGHAPKAQAEANWDRYHKQADVMYQESRIAEANRVIEDAKGRIAGEQTK